MDRQSIVFVGPSLPDRRPLRSDVAYAPPARRGDVLEAAHHTLQIGLVDGEFYQSLAVTPSEIKEAARLGARLFGAASLGALRALECPGAMIGVGRVYQQFKSGILTGDDEVAGTYVPGDLTPVSIPLVIVREAARIACEAGLLTRPEVDLVIRELKGHPFHERTPHAIGEAVMRIAGSDVAARFHTLVLSDEANVKRRDALELIDVIG